MKPLFYFVAFLLFPFSHTKAQTSEIDTNKKFAALLDSYYEEGLKLNPVNATFIGDNRYNDLLPVDFTDSYRLQLKDYYNRYLIALKQIDRKNLQQKDKISYDILEWETKLRIEGLALKDNLIPFNQFSGMPIMFAQLGSGAVGQPFKTVEDYDNWLSRASKFSAWTDSSILYFKKGIEEGYVLPKTLVVKMIPQLEAHTIIDTAKNVFYGPIKIMPSGFSDADKKRLKDAYENLIRNQLVPAYQKLTAFLKNEYLAKARTSSGIYALPTGGEIYRYRIRQLTTTSKSPDEFYNTGLSEVKRIRNEMEKIKKEVGFSGELKSFFDYLNTDPKFFPYKTPEDVLEAYRAIQQKITPHLASMFGLTPKIPFEIRQTEAFRAASAAAQYFRGSADGSRPGIFYVPIVDATKTRVEECLFLHEAIPGHHYQISLQQENTSLPDFRRFGSNSAFMEGWALYTESLGKELGCYNDPYQYMFALSHEIHRAIRLVVDAGLHSKNWTREQAIKYMMDNEPISEQKATAEIERYMAWPAQALAYKTGELKIKELRNRYQKSLGQRFLLRSFHDEILKDGAMPLEVLETKMDDWAKQLSAMSKRSL